MNQPPDFSHAATNKTQSPGSRADHPLPQWRRPQGVAPGTRDYVNERSIADHYDAFVADTPLCGLDDRILLQVLPGVQTGQAGPSVKTAKSDQKTTHAVQSQSEVGQQHREVVLDLGCGSGRSALPLASRGYAVVGIDLSQSMLEVMLQKADSAEGSVMPLRCNLVQLDCLASDSADHAVCLFSTLGMIQGRNHRRGLLRHTSRVVRRGGSLLLHVHHRWAALREYGGIRRLAGSWWASIRREDCEFGDTAYSYRGLDQMFMHRFSKRELITDLTHSGWQIVAAWPISIDGSEIASGPAIPGGYLIHAKATD